MRKIRIQDVAERTGYHKSTVSLALRNYPKIAIATRELIQKEAQKMGYQPDPSLSALAAYRRRTEKSVEQETIAFISLIDLGKKLDAYPSEYQFYIGAKKRAEELGFKLELFSVNSREMPDQRLNDILYTRGIRGIILGACFKKNRTLNFDWEKFISVKINNFPVSPITNRVASNQQQILLLAIQKMEEKGYKRIGICFTQNWDNQTENALSIAAQWDHYSNKENYRSSILLLQKQKDFSSFKEWYEEEKPEVMIGTQVVLFPFFKKMGLSIPDDISFVEYNLVDHDDPLSGIRQDQETVGQMAMETLFGQIMMNMYGLPEKPYLTLIEGEWVEGNSTPDLNTSQ